MKRFFVAVASVALLACNSVDFTEVKSGDIVSEGEAIAVIQASTMGLTMFLHHVTIIDNDLDKAINKMLIAEAKGMGANKIDLKGAATSPRRGLYSLPALLVGMPGSTAVGVAIK